MALHGNPLDSVVEEISAILARGYLRLCKARLSEPAMPSAQAAEVRIDSTPDTTLQDAIR